MAIQAPERVKLPRQHFTLKCQHCQKVIMRTRSQNFDRPVRYGVCRMCAPMKRWNGKRAA